MKNRNLALTLIVAAIGSSVLPARAAVVATDAVTASQASAARPNIAPRRSASSSLRIATREGRLKEVRELLRSPVNVNAQAERGFTPLMYAATNCHVEIANVLLKSGADANLKDARGRTALMIAASSGCPKVVSTLLRHRGTLVNTKDKSGNTAYDHAVTAAEVDYGGRASESALLLKKRGARGRTASSQIYQENQGLVRERAGRKG